MASAAKIAVVAANAAVAPQAKPRASALGALDSLFARLTQQATTGEATSVQKMSAAAPRITATTHTQAAPASAETPDSESDDAPRIADAKPVDRHARLAEALTRTAHQNADTESDDEATDEDADTTPAQGAPRHRHVINDESESPIPARRSDHAIDVERLDAILDRIEASAETVAGIRELIAAWRAQHDGGAPEGLRELISEIRERLHAARADNAPVLADLERTLAPRGDAPRFVVPVLDGLAELQQSDAPPLVRADEQKLAALVADAKPSHPAASDAPQLPTPEAAPRPAVAPQPQQTAAATLATAQATVSEVAAPTPTQTVTAPQPVAIALDTAAPDTQTLPQMPAAATLTRAFAPNALVDIAARIATKFGNGVRSFDIRLDPPELGRVDVRMEIATDGRIRAVLSAERTEAVEMLRRDGHALERALREAGLDLKDGGLTFTLKDGGGSGERFDGAWRYEAMAARRETDADTALLAPVEPAAARIRVGGLDIVI